jgi:hypothetical protein
MLVAISTITFRKQEKLHLRAAALVLRLTMMRITTFAVDFRGFVFRSGLTEHVILWIDIFSLYSDRRHNSPSSGFLMQDNGHCGSDKCS